MASHRYREAYFESPEDLEPALNDFADTVVKNIVELLSSSEADKDTIVAITGLCLSLWTDTLHQLCSRKLQVQSWPAVGILPRTTRRLSLPPPGCQGWMDYLAIPIKAE